MDKIIEQIRKELKTIGDKKTREKTQYYFKEQIESYGVKTPVVTSIGKEYFKSVKDKSKTEIFDGCENLWKSQIIEESFVACHWSHSIHKKYEPGDFDIFEKWVDSYITNWATCDSFCNHSLMALVEKYPPLLNRLKTFVTSENRWKRRASSVTLIMPAKRGKYLEDVFEIADRLLQDEDDMVQKGYGWMLKSASHAHPHKVYEFVMRNKEKMPRTALRYAIEKMPKEMKIKAMEK